MKGGKYRGNKQEDKKKIQGKELGRQEEIIGKRK